MFIQSNVRARSAKHRWIIVNVIRGHINGVLVCRDKICLNRFFIQATHKQSSVAFNATVGDTGTRTISDHQDNMPM